MATLNDVVAVALRAMVLSPGAVHLACEGCAGYGRGALVAHYASVADIVSPVGVHLAYAPLDSIALTEYTEGIRMVERYDPQRCFVVIVGVRVHGDNSIFQCSCVYRGLEGPHREPLNISAACAIRRRACVNSGCTSMNAAKKCSACLAAHYYSAACQHADWAARKMLCRELRRMRTEGLNEFY
ncbi:hypothetical protein JKP88DRAFT_255725 [Tribonema minus]|uniref:MYND-type domain-containing protein n=1 Tax=Tribonema minus TaxID=303371 RepID=A0A836CFT9_9STRA|nr:hypothetical protein JKP88DRAFT_255725 [Tribonema minus]